MDRNNELSISDFKTRVSHTCSLGFTILYTPDSGVIIKCDFRRSVAAKYSYPMQIKVAETFRGRNLPQISDF